MGKYNSYLSKQPPCNPIMNNLAQNVLWVPSSIEHIRRSQEAARWAVVAHFAPNNLLAPIMHDSAQNVLWWHTSKSNRANKHQDGQIWLILLQRTSHKPNHVWFSQKCALRASQLHQIQQCQEIARWANMAYFAKNNLMATQSCMIQPKMCSDCHKEPQTDPRSSKTGKYGWFCSKQPPINPIMYDSAKNVLLGHSSSIKSNSAKK